MQGCRVSCVLLWSRFTKRYTALLWLREEKKYWKGWLLNVWFTVQFCSPRTTTNASVTVTFEKRPKSDTPNKSRKWKWAIPELQCHLRKSKDENVTEGKKCELDRWLLGSNILWTCRLIYLLLQWPRWGRTTTLTCYQAAGSREGERHWFVSRL